jgi:hypothetical protein
VHRHLHQRQSEGGKIGADAHIERAGAKKVIISHLQKAKI